MYDIAIIGGGIVGLSTANELLNNDENLNLIILEKESDVGLHQTGNNSGVIHSGIYYQPDSLKALNCRLGIKLLLKFCKQYGIPYEICGKIIVASKKKDLNQLDILLSRGQKNGIKGLKKLSPEELKNYEPYVTGLSALYCPETGIIDYSNVCYRLSKNINSKGQIITGANIISVESKNEGIIVRTESSEYRAKFLINCAGLYADKIAEYSGSNLNSKIVPFRGEYYTLKRQAKYLIKNLVYPVPNPNYPFLGVHFTRKINGEIEAGPNAVLAWSREGYKKTDINIRDIWDYLSFVGFWRMAGKYYYTAIGEYYRSFSKSAFVSALQELVPNINAEDIVSSPAGVRAQALSLEGNLVDDFVIDRKNNIINVINAPSPAATSSFAIAKHILQIYNEH